MDALTIGQEVLQSWLDVALSASMRIEFDFLDVLSVRPAGAFSRSQLTERLADDRAVRRRVLTGRRVGDRRGLG